MGTSGFCVEFIEYEMNENVTYAPKKAKLAM